MDATRYGVVFFLLAVLNVGCGQMRVSDVSASCSSQALPTSFLVKWNGQVPPEFSSLKLSPDSLVTRFSDIEKEELEATILKNYSGQVLLAEHEFTTQSVIEESQNTLSTTSVPISSVWGPADIQAQDAWTYLGTQGQGVTVAVIDTGVDVNHPLLAGQLWTNSKEIPGNGIDDDGDGYVDDYYGYNFADNSSNLNDGVDQGSGHGTHVAGIIAGMPNSSGFTGIAPGAKIMPLKFISDNGTGSSGAAIAAIMYAVNHGAKIINASWDGSGCSATLEEEIMNATRSGTVFVNAAGNSSRDISVAPTYPAVYQVPGKITIASSNVNEVLSTFSNFGMLVDLAAPGENILSAIPALPGQPEGQMGLKSGTSMATPFVSGVAALLLSARPTASPQQIAAAINNSVVTGAFGVRTRGRVNALTAAQYLMTH